MKRLILPFGLVFLFSSGLLGLVFASVPYQKLQTTAEELEAYETGVILLVDDDNNSPDMLGAYGDALNNLGTLYDVWDTNQGDSEPQAADLSAYDTVIWFTGGAFGGFAGPGAAGETDLSTWLEGGGCLMISSQDYFRDRGLTSFMQAYFGAAAISDNTGAYSSVSGQGSIFSGLGPYALSYPFTDSADIITPTVTAQVAFSGNNGYPAAINQDNGIYRTTFWTFPWEAISAPIDREAAMAQFLSWCASPATYGVQLPPDLSATGFPGGTVNYNVVVTNTGNMTDTIDLAIAGFNWPTTLSASTVLLIPGASGSVTVSVAIPLEAISGEMDNATLTAISQGNPGIIASLEITTMVGVEPPVINVTPESVSTGLQSGEMTLAMLTITNVGAADLNWVIDEDYSLVRPVSDGVVPAANSMTIGDGAASFGSSGATGPAIIMPERETTEGLVAITHSASQIIVPGNSVSCDDGIGHTNNSYLRVFDLESFGIFGAFDVVEVEIGIEQATGAGGQQPATMNLYLWDDADPFTFANLMPIGTAAATVFDSDSLTIITVPVAGSMPAGSNLVVEFFTPNGQASGNLMRVGSNSDGQTSSSYIAAADCGVPEPMDLAALGFPGMHVVMNVTGDTDAGLASWLSVLPVTGTLPASASEEVVLTFDATGLVSDTYTTTLYITSNDPQTPLVSVPVTMEVAGESQAVIAPTSLDFGQVFVGHPQTLTLTVENAGTANLIVSNIASTDAAVAAAPGAFNLPPGDVQQVAVTYAPLVSGTLSATLSLISNDPAAPSVMVVGTAVDPPIIDVSPVSIDETVSAGLSQTVPLTISNLGSSDLIWEVSAMESGSGASPAGFRTVVLDAPGSPATPHGLAVMADRSRSDGEVTIQQPAAPSGTDPDVLLLAADEDNYSGSPMQSFLQAYGDLGIVELYNVEIATPSLAELTPYEVVVVWSDYSFWDATTLGNVLADFVDQGGAAIIMNFALPGSWEPIGGRFASETYGPLNGSGSTSDYSCLGIHEEHPVFAGVTDVCDYYRLSGASLTVNSTALGYWQDGEIFVAVKDDRPVVGIAAYVGYWYNWSGQMPDILHNTIRYLAARWLSVEPTSGIIPAGSSTVISTTLDATGLITGTYTGELTVAGNDPVTLQVVVPVTLHTIGEPQAVITPTALDFGDVFVGYTAMRQIEVENVGTANLLVSGVTADDPSLSASPQDLNVPPSASALITLTYSPTTTGSLSATVMITTNDALSPVHLVSVTGAAVEPPVINVEPASMVVGVPAGLTKTELLTTTNIGGSVLSFTLDLGRPDPALLMPLNEAAGTSSFADISLNENGGTCSGSTCPAAGNPAPGGAAVYFDGVNDSIAIPHHPAFDLIENQDHVTIEALVQIQGWPQGFFSVVDKYEASGDFGWTMQIHNSGVLNFIADPYVAGGSVDCPWLPNLNEWYHLAISYSQTAGRIQFYANGQQLCDLPFSANIINTSGEPLYLGYNPSGGNEYSLGLVDRVAIYSQALSANEVQALYAMRVSPGIGAITAGSHQNQMITLDATELNAGVYRARLVIASNDVSTPRVSVPIELQVTGEAQVVITPTSLDFGQVFVGYPQILTLTAENAGTDNLIVSDITSSDPTVTVEPSAFTLPPGDIQLVAVTYAPTAVASLSATLSMISNDPAAPSVSVTGVASEPPVINIAPESVSATLQSGEMTSTTLTISNLGGSDLDWFIGGQAASAPDGNLVLRTGDSAGGAHHELWSDDLVRSGEEEGKSASSLLNHGEANVVLPENVIAPEFSGSALLLDQLPNAGNGYFADSGCDQCAGQQSIADNFVLFEAASISEIVMWSGYFPANVPVPDAITVKIHSDGGGIPGTELYSEFPVAVNRTTTGVVLFGVNEYVHTLTLAPPVNLEPGTYWIELYNATGFGTDDWFWETGNTDPVNGIPGSAFAFTTPGSGWNTQADDLAIQLIGVGWLSASPISGTLPASSSQEVVLTFDATGLVSDTYTTTVHITSNDPLTPLLSVPITVHVTGEPEAVITPTALNFGDVFVGYSQTLTLTVENAGTDNLVVSNIASTDPTVTAAPGVFTLLPGDAQQVTVTYAPLVAGTLSATLSLISNDPAAPSVMVIGSAVDPPIIDVSPVSIDETVSAGQSQTVPLTISNLGNSDLIWEIDVTASGSGASPAGLRTVVLDAPGAPAAPDGLAVMTGHSRPDSQVTIHQPGSPLSNSPDVLLLAADDDNYSVSPLQAYLQAYGDLGSVDLYNAESSTPLLAELTPYEVIVVWSNWGFWDATALGNVLADYADQGGAVIILNFALPGSWSPIAGRFANEAYSPLNGLDATYDYSCLGIHEEHSVFAGVTDVCDYYRLSGTYLTVNSTALGYWQDGEIFVAVKNDRPVVGIAAYPGIYYEWTGQMPDVLHNAINYLAVRWLSVEPTSGIIPAGTSTVISATINATELITGTYTGELTVASNDPVTPQVAVPVTLHVVGEPQAVIMPTALDFGEVFVGYIDTRQIEVENVGTADLLVSGVTADDPSLSASPQNLNVPPSASALITLTYAPTTAGSLSATVLITSNDPLSPVALVNVTGAAVAPPVINVVPLAIEATVAVGASTTRTVTISNTGAGAALAWQSGLATLRLADDFDPDVDGSVWSSVVGGFASVNCGSVSGNALYFNGNTERSAVSRAINTLGGGTITFYLKIGTGSSPCENADSGEEVQLQYSVDNGSSWDAITVYNVDAYNNFTFVEEQIPAGATSPATMFRWTQPNHSGSCCDHWAIDDVSIGSTFLTMEPVSGTVPAGAAQDATLLFDATELVSDTYTSTLFIASNDPLTPLVSMPITLHVVGEPQAVITPTALDFGEVFVGYTAMRQIEVENVGTANLLVSGVTADDPSLSASPQNLNVPPSASALITLTYAPTTVSNLSATVTITTNDALSPVHLVSVTGAAIDPPVINVAPASLGVGGPAGFTQTELLTITNLGGADLTWNIDETNTPSVPLASSNAEGAAETVASGGPGASNPAPLTDYAWPETVLWDNGPLVTHPGGGAGGADASALQTAQLMSTYGFGHQQDQGDWVAEDFTVSDPSGWTVDSITFFAYQTGSSTSSTITNVNWQLYDSEPGAGGNLIASGGGLQNTSWSNVYRVLDTDLLNTNRPVMANQVDMGGIPLPMGTYWLAWQSDGTLASGPWAPPISILGQTSTGNAIQSLDNGASWADLVDSGSASQQGLPFIIEGTGSGGPGPCNLLSDIPWLTVSPNAGTTEAGGSDVVDVNVDSTGLSAGTYTGNLCVYSNDPQTPLVSVPITMQVEAAPLQEVVITGPITGVTHVAAEFIATGLPSTASLPVSYVWQATNQLPITHTGGLTDTVGFTWAVTGTQWITVTAANAVSMVTDTFSTTVLAAPEIVVTPLEIEATVEAEASTTRTVTISNTGAGVALAWQGGLTTLRLADDFDPDVDGLVWSSISGAFASVNCGSVTGNALYFNGSAGRSAVSRAINTLGGGTITFYLKIGTGSSPCENADSGEEVQLQYSVDNGISWNTITIYDVDAYNSFTFVEEQIPAGAASSATMFRWVQLNHSGSSFDHWAIDNVTIGSTFLTLQPVSGTVSAGAAQEATLLFDASELISDTYTSTLFIASNDPLMPLVSVPITLHVTGEPQAVVTPAQLDFGEVFVGYSYSDLISVSNVGSANLHVLAATSNHPLLSVAPTNLTVPPLSAPGVLTVTFSPTSTAPLAAAITITTTDPLNPVHVVDVLATPIVPPAVHVQPPLFDVTQDTGLTTTQTLTISNSITGTLLTFDLLTDNGIVSLMPVSGSITGPDQQVISVIFDTRTRPAGFYNDTIRVLSNDPATPEIAVPVSFAVVLVPPEMPANPYPLDQQLNVRIDQSLSWQASPHAASYDLFLWEDGQPKPGTPTASDLATAFYNPPTDFSTNTTFHWQVIAKNSAGQTDGPEWTFTSEALPDLVVSTVNAPPTSFSGQPIELSWVVTNQGNRGTTTVTWYERVYISTSPVFDVGLATYLGQATNPAYLGPGESYLNTQTFILPDGISGNYYVYVWTDYYGYMREIDENNNTGRSAGTVDISLTPPPDLQVPSVSGPANGFSGGPVQVIWEVSNEGSGATQTSNWSDRIYLSADTVLEPGSDFTLGSFNHSGALAAGAAYSVTANVNLPPYIYGDYYFFVTTDVGNAVFEYIWEDNNDSAASGPIVVVLTPPPDLLVSSLSVPTATNSGQAIDVSWTVSNNGAGDTLESYWQDRVYLSTSSTFSLTGATVLATEAHLGVLPAGESYDETRSIVVPNGISGTHYIHVWTDYAGQVFEFESDGNNVTTSGPIEITLTPSPDLQVGVVTAPLTATAGTAIDVGWTIHNAGADTPVTQWNDNLYLSTETSWSGFGTYLGSFARPEPLAAGGSYSQTRTVIVPGSLSAGNYYVYALADANNTIYEHNAEDNNVGRSIGAIAISEAPGAAPTDLVLSNLVAPASGDSGQPVELTWTVVNTSSVATVATSWTDAAYLSADDTLDIGTDTVLGAWTHSGALAGGGAYTSIKNAALPQGISGQFYLFLLTDRYELVNDPDRSNNQLFATPPISITLSPSPDLLPANLSAASSVNAGQPLNVTWSVANIGVGDGTNTWYDGIYLSNDPLLDLGDQQLTSRVHFGGLVAGDSYTKTASVTIPGYASGIYYLLVKADSRNDLYEHEAESNNVTARPITIMVPPPADLVVASVTVPPEATPGQPVTIDWSIRNDGAFTATGYMCDTVYVSLDTTWDIDDAEVGDDCRTIMLAPGQAEFLQVEMIMPERAELETIRTPEGGATGELPGVTPGQYYAIVRTDILNQIPETDDTNNAAASLDTIAIDVQELLLGVPLSGTLGTAESKYYRVDVPAGETLLISLDSESITAANELYVRYGQAPSRGNFDYGFGAPFAPDQEVLVPATISGTYYVMVYAASVPEGPANFTISAQLLNFELRGIGLTEGGQGGQVTVRLDGAQMSPNVTAALDDGVTHVNATAVYWFNGVEAYATFDLAGIPLGPYDVIMTDGAEVSTLTDAFTVVPAITRDLDVALTAPDRVAWIQISILRLQYANPGNVDIPAPMIEISVTNALFYPDDGSPPTSTLRMFAANDEGPAGVLPPGATGSFALAFKPSSPGSTEIVFSASILVPDQTNPEGQGATAPSFDYGNDSMAGSNPSDGPIITDPETMTTTELLSNHPTLQPIYPEGELIALQNFVSAPRADFFDVDLFLTEVGSDLQYYDFEEDGQEITIGSFISRVALENNINPRVLLALLEARASLVSSPVGQISGGSIGFDETSAPSLQAQIELLAAAISDEFLAVYTGRPRSTLVSKDGLLITVPDRVNNATYALIASLAPISAYSELSNQLLGIEPEFSRIYGEWFGDPLKIPEIVLDTPLPLDARLPYDMSDTDVAYTGGPHKFPVGCVAKPIVDASGLDFSDNGNFEVLSIADGTYLGTGSDDPSGVGRYVLIEHDNGLQSMYWHLDSISPEIQNIVANQRIPRGFPIGWAGDSHNQTAIHLHVELRIGAVHTNPLSGMPVPWDGKLIDDWSIWMYRWPDQAGQGANYQGSAVSGSYETRLLNIIGCGTQTNADVVVSTGYPEDIDYVSNAVDPNSKFADEVHTAFLPSSNTRNNVLPPSGAPTDLVISGIGETQIDLLWVDNSDDEDGFRVYRDGIEIATVGANVISFSDSGISCDSEHSYQVQAFNAGGGSDRSNVATGMTTLCSPDSLVAVDSGSHAVHLTWSYDAAGIVGFNIYRDGANIATVSAADRAYGDTNGQNGLDCESTYTYQVSAFDSSEESGLSNQASATTGRCSIWERIRRLFTTRVIQSYDPNDIIGPAGYGDARWVADDSVLGYTIRFENDEQLATAPAQRVVIEQLLDDDLAATSFRLGAFGFGEHIFEVPANRSYYATRLDLVADIGLYVDVVAGIDIVTDRAFWVFQSIDPATGMPPTDPLVGFLPPDIVEGEGQGFVTYVVQPGAGVQTGAVIDALASIVFDANAPIDTPPIFNTIDVDDPTATVDPLPPQTEGEQIVLSWTSNDPAGGSGVAGVDLFVAVDGGPFNLWQAGLTDLAAVYDGIPGHTYGFFARARDNADNREALQSAAEAETELFTAGPPVTVTIAAFRNGDDMELAWTHVAPNSSYELWRSQVDAYFDPGDVGAIMLAELSPPLSGDSMGYLDVAALVDGAPSYYTVVALNADGVASIPSNRVGEVPIPIVPGWNLVAWPLLPADTALDAVVGDQLYGTADPLTADRILVWDGTSQSYDSAWFCDGPVCETFGPDFYRHWLANDYSQSTLTLEPDTGFWVHNRSGVTETLALVGDVAEADRSVAVGADWQLLGSSFPISRTLDDAGLPATGTEDPLTADRVYYWSAASQSYESAWFCGGPICESWGPDFYNRWLALDYSPTDIILEPGHGFWYRNRFAPFVWVNQRPMPQ